MISAVPFAWLNVTCTGVSGPVWARMLASRLSNIRAHAGPDTPVQVTLRRVNGTAEITVVDFGPGLTDEQASHVFERFYRADGSRARANGGVGLGLAIVAAVAQAHGGDVSAHSAPGEGATFSIALPLYNKPQTAAS